MTERFFMGGMTPHGFSTQLTELVDQKEYFTYILKGGPGTGKSSLMKRVADRFAETETVTRYHCSADPDSLDAVELHASKTILVDGTPPHVFEPSLPGICQTIIDLGQYLDRDRLEENREKIITVNGLYRSAMAKASDSNKALGILCSDIRTCAEPFLDRQKIEETAQRLCDALLEKRTGRGKQTVRQLSAMTHSGYMTLPDTIRSCSNVVILSDRYFAASDLLLDIAAAKAAELGYDVKLSACLLCDPAVREHLLIDDIDTALVTSDPLTRITLPGASCQDLSRCYDKAGMQAQEERLESDLARLNGAVNASREMLRQAKRLHDEWERYYGGAMDFTALDGIFETICEETERRRQRKSN